MRSITTPTVTFVTCPFSLNVIDSACGGHSTRVPVASKRPANVPVCVPVVEDPVNHRAIRLVRVDAKVIIVTLHVREPGGEIEPTDRLDECLGPERTDDRTDELKILAQIVGDFVEQPRRTALQRRMSSSGPIANALLAPYSISRSSHTS